MNTIISFKKKSRTAWFFFSPMITSIAYGALIVSCMQFPLQAQVKKYTKPSLWYGGAVAGNFNFFNGSTQTLNSDLTTPRAFHKGFGLGLYAAPLLEFHRPDSRWGVMLQLGYDSRMGKFKEVIATPCNCPMDLSTKLSYLTIEPSLRFAPFKSNFYLFGGPRLAFNINKSFSYEQKSNPDFPPQVTDYHLKGNFSNINQTLVSMQIGVGYDIPISSQNKKMQYVVSPVVSYQPYFGESPRSIESWTLNTVRVGVIIKLGKGREIPIPLPVVIPTPEVLFTVNSPKNTPVAATIIETFPLVNYIFFDLGSTEIPNRYVILTKDQVQEFNEDQLKRVESNHSADRSTRELIVYYNILNILGVRMEKDPSSTITLVGSSEKGPEDGKLMAESVKNYLVTIFGIDASRIALEGRTKPKIPSEQPGGTRDLELLREGDRRVSIESNSPNLLMEFQTGPDAALKPVEVSTIQEAPQDSYISFDIDQDVFTSWSLAIIDEKGIVQNYGPYTNEKMSIPGKSILGDRPEGDYKVTMIGQTSDGNTVTKDTTVHMVQWQPAANKEDLRFSVIYEFNDSKTIPMYEKYLTEIVVPKIPQNATVILHGYTDIIGDAAHNQKLSNERAENVKKIIEKSLKKEGRTDVTYELDGSGEDQKLVPFNNKYPEERSYNRTVIIDIIPQK